MVKNLPNNAGEVRDAGSIPGLRRSPRGEFLNKGAFSTQNAERAPWRKLPQGGLTQARRKAKRQGDLITILTPDVPLTPIPTGVYMLCYLYVYL